MEENNFVVIAGPLNLEMLAVRKSLPGETFIARNIRESFRL